MNAIQPPKPPSDPIDDALVVSGLKLTKLFFKLPNRKRREELIAFAEKLVQTSASDPAERGG
jgi:hypothetical protein